jgi:hypothetical protein
MIGHRMATGSLSSDPGAGVTTPSPPPRPYVALAFEDGRLIVTPSTNVPSISAQRKTKGVWIIYHFLCEALLTFVEIQAKVQHTPGSPLSSQTSEPHAKPPNPPTVALGRADCPDLWPTLPTSQLPSTSNSSPMTAFNAIDDSLKAFPPPVQSNMFVSTTYRIILTVAIPSLTIIQPIP